MKKSLVVLMALAALSVAATQAVSKPLVISPVGEGSGIAILASANSLGNGGGSGCITPFFKLSTGCVSGDRQAHGSGSDSVIPNGDGITAEVRDGFTKMKPCLARPLSIFGQQAPPGDINPVSI